MIENSEELVKELAEKYLIQGYLDEGRIRGQISRFQERDEAIEHVAKMYEEAVEKRERAYQNRIANFEKAETIQDFQNVKETLDALCGYKDSVMFSNKCQNKIDELKEKRALQRKEEEAVMEERLVEVYKQDKKELIWTVIGIFGFLIIATILLLWIGSKLMLWQGAIS